MASKHLGLGANREQDVHVPYIPPEVHRMIAQYIHFSDLPHYRLVSRILSAIGAEELFSTITFHCSSGSIARINAIKTCPHLNRYVTTIVWDSNLWKIPNVRDLHEWRRYFHGRAFAAQQHGDAEHRKLADTFNSLRDNQEEWERYLDRARDEKVAKNFRNLQNMFSGFKNLCKLHILNGDLTVRHRGLEKRAEKPHPPECTFNYWRGESLNVDGLPVYHSERPCGYALAAIDSFGDISWRLTKLRLNSVCCKVFYGFMDGIQPLRNFSSFHLKLTVLSEPLWGRDVARWPRFYSNVLAVRNLFHHQVFMGFLVKLPELESLKLDFCGRYFDENDIGHSAPATVGDIFDPGHTWPRLRRISLLHADTTHEALSSLLKRHQSTLKVLKLHAMMLEPDQNEVHARQSHARTWTDIFDEMNEVLHLEHAKLSGYFSIKDSDVPGCNFENEQYALAASAYLVTGGDSPLRGTKVRQ
ncbi:hypothetical protein CC86DRAFT_463700 [Ophiobolus disseminans]|uniref:F-box domain-containing protein n=1 Tax=Ophiobolus disseminans TaxID=1469910 RepID=A0A6A7AAP6_9PLEO|nr:hypothetical protein CC86DRAFT_463700 [Ophiobolus disseminans]